MSSWALVSVVLIFSLTTGGTLRIVLEVTSGYFGGGLHFSPNRAFRQVGSRMTVASASVPVPPSAPDSRRWATLAIVCLAQLMIVLDVTIVNVALPLIQRELHFSQG